MKSIPVKHIANSFREQNKIGRFNIRAIQQILNGKALVHELHKHDFYFILAIDKGSGIHEIDFVAYPVSGHAVFILRPGQVHRLELELGSSGFLMEFDLSFYQPRTSITDLRWRKASGKNFCALETARYKKLQNVLANILHEYTHKQDGFIEIIKANLDIFFIEFNRQSSHPGRITNTESNYIQTRFEEFSLLLETNICSLKNVSQYADRMHLSVYQLNAITKSAVGKTVSALISEQVLLEAKRYLLATSDQIKDIADHLGYEDVSYFIRFFKKQTGHSPDAFRNNFT